MISESSNFLSGLKEFCCYFWELFLFFSFETLEDEGLLTFFELDSVSAFFFNCFLVLSAFLLFSDFLGLWLWALTDFLAEVASFFWFFGAEFSFRFFLRLLVVFLEISLESTAWTLLFWFFFGELLFCDFVLTSIVLQVKR